MRTIALAALCCLAASPAVADTTSGSSQARAPRDPNRMICRRVETIGSRIDAKRVCRTAAEWEEQRTLDRQQLESSQTQRYVGNVVEPTGG